MAFFSSSFFKGDIPIIVENYVYVQFPLSPPIALEMWWLKNYVLSFQFPITLSLEKVVVKEVCLIHSISTSPSHALKKVIVKDVYIYVWPIQFPLPLALKIGDGKRSMSDPFPPPLRMVMIKEICLTRSLPTSHSLALKKWRQKNQSGAFNSHFPSS